MCTCMWYRLDLACAVQEDGRVGDAFMNQIQDVASKVPYMVVPGNHEWLE